MVNTLNWLDCVGVACRNWLDVSCFVFAVYVVFDGLLVGCARFRLTVRVLWVLVVGLVWVILLEIGGILCCGFGVCFR